MRTSFLLVLSLGCLYLLTATGCSTMAPEQVASAPLKQYNACRYVPNSPKCHGQAMSTRAIEARKAYAADVLEREQRYRDATTRHDRDL